MKISSISDVHVVEENDNRGIVLKNFLSNPIAQSSDIIIFLGDVFDFLYGEREFYIRRYENFFLMIDRFLEDKKKLKVKSHGGVLEFKNMDKYILMQGPSEFIYQGNIVE